MARAPSWPRPPPKQAAEIPSPRTAPTTETDASPATDEASATTAADETAPTTDEAPTDPSDPRLAALAYSEDLAAAESQAAVDAASSVTDEPEAAPEGEAIPESEADIVAARLNGLVPEHVGAMQHAAPPDDMVSTQVIVTGLVSVASIASFKRHLSRLSRGQLGGRQLGPRR